MKQAVVIVGVSEMGGVCAAILKAFEGDLSHRVWAAAPKRGLLVLSPSRSGKA
jgi:hypothetical protein